jgi:hypothetical protein
VITLQNTPLDVAFYGLIGESCCIFVWRSPVGG